MEHKTSAVTRWVSLVILLIIVLFPFYWMVITAFQTPEFLYNIPPILFPKKFTFVSMKNIFVNYPVAQWLNNTFLVSILTAFLSVFISSLSAYSLSRYKAKGQSVIQTSYLIPQMIPTSLLIIPIYIIWNRIGLLDNLFGLVLTSMTFTIPICILLLKSFFDAIPEDIEEAALIDGCNRFQVLMRVVLPLAAPGLIATGAYAFLIAWDDFLFGVTLVSDSSKWIFSVGLTNAFMGQLSTQWNELMGTAIIGTLPPVILFLFAQRFIVEGLTQGSVKG